MSVKEVITDKIEEIEDASDVMHPIEDIHIWDELKRLSSEIIKASEQMIPIKDLHIGKDIVRMAKEIDKAQNVMLGLPESRRDKLNTLMRCYADSKEVPVLLCDTGMTVIFANKAAAEKFGPDIEGKNAEETGLALQELRDSDNILKGYCLSAE